MTPFGNEDPIDKRNLERIRKLEARNKELESGLRSLTNAFACSTSMTQREKELVLVAARQVLAKGVHLGP